jgi:hypothetical protein
MKKCYSKLLIICILFTSVPTAQADSTSVMHTLTHWAGENIVLLPDYRLTMDISSFLFHKNTFFKQTYLAEPNPHFEFTFIDISDIFYSLWDVDFLFGLGNLPDNVVFTVLRVAFGIAPSFELRLRNMNIRTGIEHRCFHGVDRKLYPVVHWNTGFLALNSKNFRYGDYWKPLAEHDGWTMKNRWAWQLQANYYIKHLGALASPNKLNGNNPRWGDLSASGRFSFYRRRSWIVNTQSSLCIGVTEPDSSKETYRRFENGLEMHFRRGVKGATFYTKYIIDNNIPLVDGQPWFSKDHLLQFGFRFFD